MPKKRQSAEPNRITLHEAIENVGDPELMPVDTPVIVVNAANGKEFYLVGSKMVNTDNYPATLALMVERA